jgi:stress response protein SCP2
MGKKLFAADDFEKQLSIGDQLVFDKQELKRLRLELVWKGTDLDICAFLLGNDGMIHEKTDLVYFKSQLRWKTKKPFNDPDFDPLDGKVSTWAQDNAGFKNQMKWMDSTLPLSTDASVIGSWDDMAEDENDDADCGETMHVLLEEVDTKKYSSIVFAAVVAMDRIKAGETFEDANNPIFSIYDADTDQLVAEYKLASQFPGKDAVCIGKMEFDEKSLLWSFVPMADGYKGGIQYLAQEVFD